MLTEFQMNLEKAVTDVIVGDGSRVSRRLEHSGNNSYILVAVDRKELECYLYDNEGMFVYRGKRFYFEKEDYDSQNKLIESYAAAVAACLKNKYPDDPGSGGITIFKWPKF